MKYFLILLAAILVFTSTFSAQQQYENEVMDDAYLPMPPDKKRTGPAYKFVNASIFTTQVNIDIEGDDIFNDAANEPSIGIDPTNPLRMVIGWRQFENIESNFRQAGIAYTEDGGITWNNMEPLEPELFRSDPVIDTDSQGNFYYNSLTTDFFCDVFKSNDLMDWSDKTSAFGGDKQWMVIDKTANPSNGQTYEFWAEPFSVCPDMSFTRAINFEDGFEGCSEIPANLRRGTINIDPNGDLYACGTVGPNFQVLKSSSAKDPEANVEWEQTATVDMKGTMSLYQGPNPSGMLGQAWVTTDHSNTDLNGNVYLLATVERDDVNDNADIMFSRSTDGGANWSEAIQINDDDEGNWNWFGTISVAPNGRIDVVFVDTRDDQGTYYSSLYYSHSEDGGLTWSENENLSEAFDPHLGFPNQEKIGDYYHMISTNEGAHLAWCGTFNGGQDVYYSYITPDQPIGISELENNPFDLTIYPNPTKDLLNIRYKNDRSGTVKIALYNLAGQEIGVFQNKWMDKGVHQITVDDLNAISSGMYFIRISDNSGSSQRIKFAID